MRTRSPRRPPTPREEWPTESSNAWAVDEALCGGVVCALALERSLKLTRALALVIALALFLFFCFFCFFCIFFFFFLVSLWRLHGPGQHVPHAPCWHSLARNGQETPCILPHLALALVGRVLFEAGAGRPPAVAVLSLSQCANGLLSSPRCMARSLAMCSSLAPFCRLRARCGVVARAVWRGGGQGGRAGGRAGVEGNVSLSGTVGMEKKNEGRRVAPSVVCSKTPHSCGNDWVA